MILRFNLGASPARVSIHVIPVKGDIPRAKDVVFVVESPDQILAAPMPNPFYDVGGGTPTVGPLSLEFRGVPEKSARIQLVRGHTQPEAKDFLLYLEVAEGVLALEAAD